MAKKNTAENRDYALTVLQTNSWIEETLLSVFDQSFLLYRQPILNLHNNVIRYEILIRRRDKKGEIIPGGAIVEECERNGSIMLLDRWVFAQIVNYLTSSNDSAHYSINLSPFALAPFALAHSSNASNRLVTEIWKGLSLSPGLSSRLGFEITERGAIDWIERGKSSASLLNYLRQHDFYVSLDDFGAGHCLADLTDRVRPSAIKIDKFFSARMIRDQRYFALMQHLVAIAHAFNTEVVAEGIETLEMGQLAARSGCDWVQGWAIGMPEPLPGWQIRQADGFVPLFR